MSDKPDQGVATNMLPFHGRPFMGPSTALLLPLLIFLPSWISLCLSQATPANLTAETLDVLLRDDGLWALRSRRARTGLLCTAAAGLAGVEVGAVRLKSGSFWSRGVNYSSVSIPTRVRPSPYVRRLAVVYQNLGNWSAQFYSVPGHRLVAPVVGFHVYNATSLYEDGGGNGSYRRLDLSVTGEPIAVYFPALEKMYATNNSSTKCISFDEGGSDYQYNDLVPPNACLTRTQGHFSVVVPLPTILPASPGGRGRERWKLWVVVVGCGVAAVALVGLVVWGACRGMEKKKMMKMHKESDDGEALGSVWIGGSRLPTAPAIRTQPVLEHQLAP